MNLDHSSHIYSLIAGGCIPEELKLVLISSDESKYNALEKIRRQYLAVMRGHEDESAIIKSCDQLINVLNSLMIVAQERKEMFAKVGVCSIMDYNSFVGEPEHVLPNIVVVIDDFADFIKEAGRRVETPLFRLAQSAKRFGIYISLCTNQTSDDVITGVINSLVQAKKVGVYPPIFVGGEFLKLIDDIEQREYTGEQYTLPYCKVTHLRDYKENTSEVRLDPMFEGIAKYVVREQECSARNLQEMVGIGSKRANFILDQLAEHGIVSYTRTSKGREVLVHSTRELNKILKKLDL